MALLSFIQDYIDKGFVKKCDKLRGSFPIKLVAKKAAGQFRIVHDLRALNKFFNPPGFKLPSPMAPCVMGYPFVAKVDIADCFLRFALSERFSSYFGFNIRGQGYKFASLPFGWSMSPYLVTKFLRPLQYVFA